MSDIEEVREQPAAPGDETVGRFVEQAAAIISGAPFPSGRSLSKARQISDLALALYAAPQQPAAPGGEAVGDWVLVPRVPTLDMANAAWRELESQGIDPEYVEAQQVWGAMLAAAPSRAPHHAITHCDNCGCDWLDNGLNPVGCPYCKQSEHEHATAQLQVEIERLRAEVAEWKRLAAALEDAQMGLRYAVRVWVLSDEIEWSEAEIDEAVERIIGDAKKEPSRG